MQREKTLIETAGFAPQGICFRLDAMDGYLALLPKLTEYEDVLSIVIVQHEGTTKENPHFHGVVKTTAQNQTFRKRLKTLFTKGKGNGHMSVKDWDGNYDAISYLFHEDPTANLLVQKGFTDEDITKARERNIAVRQQVLTAKQKASWRVEELVYRECDPKNTYTNEYLAKRIFLVAQRTGKYAPTDFKCKQMVLRIQFLLCEGNEDAEEFHASNYASGIFRFG